MTNNTDISLSWIYLNTYIGKVTFGEESPIYE
jgi:hypothetical protein